MSPARRAAAVAASVSSPVASLPDATPSSAAHASLPLQPRSYLAFDFGTRRIGVASGNTLTRRAAPLRSIDARGDAAFAAIGDLIREWQPNALIVGVPRHPDGQPHEVTAQAERFARRLQGRFGLGVVSVDERYSTLEAQSRQRGAPGGPQGQRDGDRREPGDIDARSAAVILEQFFNELRADDVREDARPADELRQGALP